MDKKTISTFLWIIVSVVTMLSLIAFASPFGVYLKDTVETFTGTYVEDATETEESADKPMFTLTITYDTPNDVAQIADFVSKMQMYQSYDIPSPEIIGYTPNMDRVTGIITSETTVGVTYNLARYTLVYRNNEGDWIDESYEPPIGYTYKDSFQLPDGNDISRANYTFCGWYDNSDFLGDPITEIKPTDYGNKILYAKWKSTGYDITYVLNDQPASQGNLAGEYYIENEYYDTNGDNKVEATFRHAKWDDEPNQKLKEYTYGEEFNLPTAVSKFGYTFKGWKDENGEIRTQIVATDSGDKTFYAQWERNTYEIRYHLDFYRNNGNGSYSSTKSTFSIVGGPYTVTHSDGTVEKLNGYPTTYKYGDTIDLSKIGVAATGYDGQTTNYIWVKSDYGKNWIGYTYGKTSLNTDYKKSISAPIKNWNTYTTCNLEKKYDHSDLDLYIVPTPNKYQVEFLPNDPTINYEPYVGKSAISGTMSKQSFWYDKNQTLSKNQFKCVGYTFVGWNTKADGTGTSYTDQQTVKNLTATHNGVVKLYAQWTQGTTENGESIVNKYSTIVEFRHFEYDSSSKTTTGSVYPTETIKFMSDENITLDDYIKTISGFTYAEIRYRWVSENNSLRNKINVSSTKSIGAIPNDNDINKAHLVIDYYYTRNEYELNVLFNETQTTQITYNGTAYTKDFKIKVTYGEDVTLVATVNSPRYRAKSSAWSLKNPALSVFESYNVVSQTKLTFKMPYENTKIEYLTEDNTGTATFKGNGGSPSSQTKDYIYGQAYGSFPSATRQCYTFNGWYTSASGGTKVTTSSIFNGPVTLYAQWTRKGKDDSCHSYTKVVSSSTSNVSTSGVCQQTSTKKECQYCGIQKTFTSNDTSHNEETIQLQSQTCYQGKKTRKQCKTCGYIISTETGDPSGTHLESGIAQCSTVHSANVSWAHDSGGSSHKIGAVRHVFCGRDGKCTHFLDAHFCLRHGLGSSIGTWNGVTCYNTGANKGKAIPYTISVSCSNHKICGRWRWCN